MENKLLLNLKLSFGLASMDFIAAIMSIMLGTVRIQLFLGNFEAQHKNFWKILSIF